jgi:hypothetical protein
MSHTLELRNPFLNLDIVRFALHLPKEWRTDKKILKDTFSPMLPSSIVNRKKEALKNPEIAQRLKSQGIDITALGPKPAQEFVNKQIDVWGAFIKANNIKATD